LVQGCEVWALVRSEAQRERIRSAGGLRLVDATTREEAAQQQQLHRIEAFADAAEVTATGKEADVLVVLTKSYDTQATADRVPLRDLVRRDGGGVVLTLQNGMGNREILQASLVSSAGDSHGGPVVLQGITDVGALLTQPGEH
jgi:ketopantoate reductase